jgi:hypothetical protein
LWRAAFIVAAAIHVPPLTEYNSAEVRLVLDEIPPAARIFAEVVEFDEVGSCVRLKRRRPFAMLPVAAQEPLVGL